MYRIEGLFSLFRYYDITYKNTTYKYIMIILGGKYAKIKLLLEIKSQPNIIFVITQCSISTYAMDSMGTIL